MNELETLVTVVKHCFVITLPNEMTYTEIELSCSKIIMKASNISATGAIFDLSNLTVLDSYAFRILEETSRIISLMGIITVWIGLRPGVISSLLDLNVNVSSIKCALNLEQGFDFISKKQRC